MPTSLCREKPPPTVETVEAMVRAQLATSLGGPAPAHRGRDPECPLHRPVVGHQGLRLALSWSGAGVAVALLVRLFQRWTVQFVLNALLVAIGFGFPASRRAAAAPRTTRRSPTSCPASSSTWATRSFRHLALFGWPLVGFMLGSVTGDPPAGTPTGRW